MRDTMIDMNCPIFQSVKQVAKITGLSEWALRQGLKAGTIPYIRNGKRILINLPQLLNELDEQTKHSSVSP